MNVAVVGMNHKTAPVELRECLAMPEPGAHELLRKFSALPSVEECMFLSTCNRVEALVVSPDADQAACAVKKILAQEGNAEQESIEAALYVLQGREAVRHLFRVSSSLDSMVVGEPQILGQIKEAYRSAVKNRCSGVVMNRLLHRAFFVAKRVRSETGIGSRAVSVSYTAVELAKKIFGRIDNKTILLIGAGEMAELAVRHLVRNGVRAIFVANRTFERAMDLAGQFRGRAVLMEELIDLLREVDIVISSTGAPGFVVSHDQVHGLARKRKNRPLFFIDIAVPRDIDPRINDMPNTYVYDIDELEKVVESNIRGREQEAVQGERIVEEEAVKFERWLQALDAVDTMKDLVGWANDVREKELQRTLPRMGSLTPRQVELLDAMSASIVKRLLHHPLAFLKRDRAHKEKRVQDVEALRTIFHLNGTD